MKNNLKHQRENDILLGPLERPAIQWLVRHLPEWSTPDMMTCVGFIGAFVISVAYVLTGLNERFLWLASLGFLINWFGDSLDGSLARYRRIERPAFGYFIDHTVDAFTQLMIGISIGLSPYAHISIALYALTGYFMVSIHTYITVYVRGLFKISYGRFGPTEARLLAILANSFILIFGNPVIDLGWVMLSLFDIFLACVGTLLIIIYVSATVRQAEELAMRDKTRTSH